MRGKKLLPVLIAMAIFGLTLAIPSRGLQWEGKMAVTPQAIVDPSMQTGSTFVVNIRVSDLANLYGFEFKMSYNTAVVSTSAGKVQVGDVFGPLPGDDYYVWRKRVTGGVVWLAVTQELGGVDGVSFGRGESGLLATIEFSVIGAGSSALDLYNVKLADNTGDPIGLLEAADGFFSNLDQGVADLVDWKARKEHNAFDFDRDNDGMQSFYGNVMNFGTQPVAAKVVFNIFDPFGMYVATVETPEATLAAGTKQVLEAKWGGMQQGKRYIVEAQAWYGASAGLSVYTLEFHVQPPPKLDDPSGD